MQWLFAMAIGERHIWRSRVMSCLNTQRTAALYTDHFVHIFVSIRSSRILNRHEKLSHHVPIIYDENVLVIKQIEVSYSTAF